MFNIHGEEPQRPHKATKEEKNVVALTIIIPPKVLHETLNTIQQLPVVMRTINMQAELYHSTYMSSIAAPLAFLYESVSDAGSPLSKEAMQTAFSCFCKEGRGGQECACVVGMYVVCVCVQH